MSQPKIAPYIDGKNRLAKAQLTIRASRGSIPMSVIEVGMPSSRKGVKPHTAMTIRMSSS